MNESSDEEIKQTAQSLINRFKDKRRAERYAMERQNNQSPATPGKHFWAGVAQAIRKWR